MAGPITIAILGDNRGLNKSLGQSESRLKRLGGIAGGAGKVIGAGLLAAGAAAVTFGAKAVKSASDAQQSFGATETVFGKFASKVVGHSDRAAQSVGLSANEYRENANLIGSLFKNQGVEADKLAGKTRGMIKTGADLAATFGGPTSDAVAALGSAFKGEFDPLERYGISIKQSTINAELAARGQDKLTGAALKAAQQQATTRLVMDQSADSAGAFGREANTLAGQQQRLGASWENIKAKAGGVLLPVLTTLASTVNTTVLPAFERMGPPALELAKSVGEKLAPAVSKVGAFLAVAGPVAASYGQTLLTIGQSVRTNLLPPVISAASYLSATFGPVLKTVGRIIVGQVVPAVQAVGRFVAGTLLPIVGRLAKTVGGNLRPVFDQVAKTLQGQVLPAVQKGAARFKEMWPTIQRVITAVAKVTATSVAFGTKITGTVLPPVIKFAGFLLGTVIRAVVGVIGVLVRIGGAVVTAGQKFVAGVAQVARFTSAVTTKIGEAIRTVSGIPGKITSALVGAGTLLFSTGQNIIGGLISGITSMASSLVSSITSSVTDKIPGFIKKRLGIASPSRVLKRIGVQIMDGLIGGIRGGNKGVNSALKKVTGLISGAFKKITGDKISTKRLRQIVGSIGGEIKTLQKLAGEYKKVGRQLEKARDQLKTVKDFAGQLRAGAVEFADVTGAGVLDDDGLTTAGRITQGLTERLAAIRSFTEKIDQLRSAGLDKSVIGQILAEGVEGGMATAQALVAGGADAIAEVNSLSRQIADAAGDLGQAGASAMFKGGQAAAQQLVNGLERDANKLDRAAARIAGRLTNALRRNLGRKTIRVQLPKLELTDTTSTNRPKFTEAAKRSGSRAGGDGSVSVKLSAEQVSQLQRGKAIQLDLDAYYAAGGRPKAT